MAGELSDDERRVLAIYAAASALAADARIVLEEPEPNRVTLIKIQDKIDALMAEKDAIVHGR